MDYGRKNRSSSPSLSFFSTWRKERSDNQRRRIIWFSFTRCDVTAALRSRCDDRYLRTRHAFCVVYHIQKRISTVHLLRGFPRGEIAFNRVPVHVSLSLFFSPLFSFSLSFFLTHTWEILRIYAKWIGKMDNYVEVERKKLQYNARAKRSLKATRDLSTTEHSLLR